MHSSIFQAYSHNTMRLALEEHLALVERHLLPGLPPERRDALHTRARQAHEAYLFSIPPSLEQALDEAARRLPGASKNLTEATAFDLLTTETTRADLARQQFYELLPAYAAQLTAALDHRCSLGNGEHLFLSELLATSRRDLSLETTRDRIPAVREGEIALLKAFITGQNVVPTYERLQRLHTEHHDQAQELRIVSRFSGSFASELTTELSPRIHRHMMHAFDELRLPRQREVLAERLEADALRSPLKGNVARDVREHLRSESLALPVAPMHHRGLLHAAESPFAHRDFHHAYLRHIRESNLRRDHISHLLAAHTSKLERFFALRADRGELQDFLRSQEHLARRGNPQTGQRLYADAVLAHASSLKAAVQRAERLRHYAARHNLELYPVDAPSRVVHFHGLRPLSRGIVAAIIKDRDNLQLLDVTGRKDATLWKPGQILERPALPPPSFVKARSHSLSR